MTLSLKSHPRPGCDAVPSFARRGFRGGSAVSGGYFTLKRIMTFPAGIGLRLSSALRFTQNDNVFLLSHTHLILVGHVKDLPTILKSEISFDKRSGVI